MAEVIVVGGGPAGIMAGLLLARHGVRVLVLEKHGDFLRDFRGDTVHPSTMSALADLELLDAFLARPHHRIDRAEFEYDGQRFAMGDLSHSGGPAPFIAMMPQWDFLDFLRGAAETYPGFALRMNAEVVGLEEAGGRIVGVRLPDGARLAAGKLVLMCDGRGSLARGILPLEDLGAPIDVLWFRVPNTRPGSALRGVVRGDRLLVMIDRGDYWQCAAVIRKGGAEALRARGIAAFRASVAAASGLERLEEALPDWDAVKLLTVSLDRLTRWHRPGLLAIGDAAHAMSPVGGIGINLAIQDAVTVGNVLGPALARGRDVEPLPARVQAMRMGRTRLIQGAQALAHRRLIGPLLERGGDGAVSPPWMLRQFDAHPLLQRIPGWLIANAAGRQRVKEA